MMITLSKNGQDLVDSLTSMLAEDEIGEAYFEMIKHIDEYKRHLESGIELAQAATARLLLVAQHVAGDETEPTEQA